MAASRPRWIRVGKFLLIGIVGVTVIVALYVAGSSKIRFGRLTLVDPTTASVRSWAAAMSPVGSDIHDVLKTFGGHGIQPHHLTDLSMDLFANDFVRTRPEATEAYMTGAPVEYWPMQPMMPAHHQVYVFVDAQGRVVDVKVLTQYTGP